MKLSEVQRIALVKGVDCVSGNKLEIIRRIQVKEGFEPCFGTKKFECEQKDCLWWEDCQGKVRIVEEK